MPQVALGRPCREPRCRPEPQGLLAIRTRGRRDTKGSVSEAQEGVTRQSYQALGTLPVLKIAHHSTIRIRQKVDVLGTALPVHFERPWSEVSKRGLPKRR